MQRMSVQLDAATQSFYTEKRMDRDREDADRYDDRLDRDEADKDAARERRDKKKSHLEDESPGARLHFGSAGSGGAEFEQIPDKDEEP